MSFLYRVILAGNPGSGKSSIGDALIDLTGGRRLSFAAGVKEEVARVLLATDADAKVFDRAGQRVIDERHVQRLVARMNDPETKDQYRSMLQNWGTDVRRAQDPQYWIKQWAETFNGIREYTNIVVDDARFPNEEAALRSNGFYFVRLLDGPTTRPMDPDAAVHESESYWPTWEYDLTLSYEPGPELQARRILAEVIGRQLGLLFPTPAKGDA
jgi:hypothetical protein